MSERFRSKATIRAANQKSSRIVVLVHAFGAAEGIPMSDPANQTSVFGTVEVTHAGEQPSDQLAWRGEVTRLFA